MATVFSTAQAEALLANRARSGYRGQDVLYHGTRYAPEILASGILLAAPHGLTAVSLTRSAEVAAYSALLPRDNTNNAAAILVLSRQSLRTRYAITPHHDYDCHGDEAEEVIWDDILDIKRHLLGVVREKNGKPFVPVIAAGSRRRAVALRVKMIVGRDLGSWA
jgi:hypothetical protein